MKSWWYMRKQRRYDTRDACLRYMKYLQTLLAEGDIQYQEFKHFNASPYTDNSEQIYQLNPQQSIKKQVISRTRDDELPSPTELEHNIETKAGGIEEVASCTLASSAGAQSELLSEHMLAKDTATQDRGVTEFFDMAADSSRESSPRGVSLTPRNTHDPWQCQICRRKFETRNNLFQHLQQECLFGQMVRSGANDSSHRKRWKMRARKRGKKMLTPAEAETSAVQLPNALTCFNSMDDAPVTDATNLCCPSNQTSACLGAGRQSANFGADLNRLEGAWTHSNGGVVFVLNDGEHFMIQSPHAQSVRLSTSEFAQADGLHYYQHIGRLSDNVISWSNGSSWSRTQDNCAATSANPQLGSAFLGATVMSESNVASFNSDITYIPASPISNPLPLRRPMTLRDAEKCIQDIDTYIDTSVQPRRRRQRSKRQSSIADTTWACYGTKRRTGKDHSKSAEKPYWVDALLDVE